MNNNSTNNAIFNSQRNKIFLLFYTKPVLKTKYSIQAAIAKVNCNKQVYAELFAFILSTSAFRIPRSVRHSKLYTDATKFKVKIPL